METIGFNLNEKDSSVVIKINSKVYPLHTIYSASYVFLDRCYIMLDGDPEKEILVELRLKKGSNLDLGILAKEFFNELLNYAFYEEQSRKNASLRDTLLRTALLSNLGAEEFGNDGKQIDGDVCNEDWSEIEDIDDEDFDDPEGIAVPWEEKYGKSTDKKDKCSEGESNNPDVSKKCSVETKKIISEGEENSNKTSDTCSDLEDDKDTDRVSSGDPKQSDCLDNQECSEKKIEEEN